MNKFQKLNLICELHFSYYMYDIIVLIYKSVVAQVSARPCTYKVLLQLAMRL